MKVGEELPSGWMWTRLDEVASWSSGGTPKATEPKYYGGGIPWAVIGDLNDGRVADTASTLTVQGLQQSSAKLVPAGTLLVAMYGSIGKLGIAAQEMATNQAIACGEVDEAVDPRFVFWWLFLQRPHLVAAGRGGTQRNISQTILKPWPVPLPPAREQRRIVAEIERRLSHLDAAERSLLTARAKIQTARRALLRQTATGGLRGVSRTVDSKLGGSIPRHWQTTTIADLVAEGRRSAYGVLKPGDHVDDGVPFIRVGDLNNGAVDLSQLKRIDPDIAANYPRTQLQGGELLLSIVGTIGRCGVVPATLAGANVARAVAVIPLDADRIRAEFLSLVLESSPFHERLVAGSNEVARKTLNLETLRSFRVPLPPLDEQDQLLTVFSRRASLLDAADSSTTSSLRRCARLRRSVLTCAFRGQLVPQDPTDAPADVMITRIHAAR